MKSTSKNFEEFLMKVLRRAALLAAIVQLASCSSIWAQVFAGRVTDDLLAMESYKGTLVQRRLLPDAPETDVVQQVLYARPWKVRAEVTAPESLKGTLFLYDGTRTILWWPRELFGIRVRGMKSPTREEVKAHVEREMKSALGAYAYSMDGIYPVAGHKVNRWRVLPLDKKAPFRMTHTSWVYEPYAYPLKVDFYTDDELWYGMEFEKIDFGVPVAEDSFAFEFPENAVVFDWDVSGPGMPLDEARRAMNFEVRLPKKLPEGHGVRKIVRSTHCLPMIAVLMDRGASWISLTESRALSSDYLPRFGKEIALGDSTGYLYFAGTYSIISWVKGKTALTLVGNLSFPQMIEIARSVE